MSEPIISTPAKSITTLEAEDRRSVERYICRRQSKVRVLVKPGMRGFTASIRDISSVGIGLIVEQPCQPGALLALQLRSRGARFSSVVAATVKHATLLPEGHWLWGCSLSRSLTDDEVLGLV
jgi:PilZ domain